MPAVAEPPVTRSCTTTSTVVAAERVTVRLLRVVPDLPSVTVALLTLTLGAAGGGGGGGGGAVSSSSMVTRPTAFARVTPVVSLSWTVNTSSPSTTLSLTIVITICCCVAPAENCRTPLARP